MSDCLETYFVFHDYCLRMVLREEQRTGKRWGLQLIMDLDGKLTMFKSKGYRLAEDSENEAVVWESGIRIDNGYVV